MSKNINETTVVYVFYIKMSWNSYINDIYDKHMNVHNVTNYTWITAYLLITIALSTGVHPE